MPSVYAIFSLVSIASLSYGFPLAAVNANAAASVRRSPVRIRLPDHVDDAIGEVVLGTPSQVVLDRAYRETGVVDVAGTPGAVADLRCRFDLPFQRVQELEYAGRDPRADVPRAVSVASRHRQERVDHVRNIDQIPPLLPRAVDQDGLPVLQPLGEDGDHPAFEVRALPVAVDVG